MKWWWLWSCKQVDYILSLFGETCCAQLSELLLEKLLIAFFFLWFFPSVPAEITIKNSSIPIKHFGLSLAKDSMHSQFTVRRRQIPKKHNHRNDKLFGLLSLILFWRFPARVWSMDVTRARTSTVHSIPCHMTLKTSPLCQWNFKVMNILG